MWPGLANQACGRGRWEGGELPVLDVHVLVQMLGKKHKCTYSI